MEFLEEAKFMDHCTHEVRMQYWKNIISQCQARPAGQTAKQWMTENGICEQTYYLWQRRIRKETYEQMSSQELVIKTNACSIALSADIPDSLLSRILKEVSHA